MQVVNIDTASVVATAGGTEILSAANASLAQQQGLNCVVVNPSVDCALVDVGGTSPVWTAALPFAVEGTIANSPFVCPAGVPTVIMHRGGPVRMISSSGAATVKRALGMVP